MPEPVSIQAKRLTKQQAAPRAGSVISPHRQEVADTLTPQRLGSLMRQADEGDPEAYFVLAEEMEEREPHYSSVLATRKLGVAGLPTMVTAPDDSGAAKDVTDAVEQLVQRPEFEGLVLDLMDGVPKGMSCVETIWDRGETRWEPVRYEFRAQRHFVFDADTMTIPLLRDDAGGEGIALDPYKWIVHMPRLRSGVPLRTGIARTIAVCYAAKRWTVADWLAFLDIYGIPVRLGKYPSHMADKKAALLRAIMAIGSDAAAVIPQEMEVEIIQATGGATGGGKTLFQQSAEYWDKQVSKVVLGQTMTTDDGASLSQSKTHEKVRQDILAADARAIAATLNRDLIKPYIDLNFGPQKAYPAVSLVVDDGEDLTPWMKNVEIYVKLGGRVQASEVRDRLGLSEPEDGAELLKAPGVAAGIGAKGPVVDTDTDDVTKGDPAKDDDEIAGDGKSSEMNAAQQTRAPSPYDATDEHVDAELKKWRSLENDNVGRLIREIQNAKSYEEARTLLEELKRDEGDVLDIGALVVSLARGMFKLRGNGDATDAVKP
jgi:phage gp29-like protein